MTRRLSHATHETKKGRKDYRCTVGGVAVRGHEAIRAVTRRSPFVVVEMPGGCHITNDWYVRQRLPLPCHSPGTVEHNSDIIAA